MAFQLSWSDPTRGLLFPLAYHRLNELSIDTVAGRATLLMSVYVDKAASDGKLQPIAGMPFTMAGNDFATLAATQAASMLDATTISAFDVVRKLAYTWLTKRAEYVGAVSV